MTVLDSGFGSPAGWTFTETLTDDGGLRLTDMRHDHYSFAADVRIEKVWFGNGGVNPQLDFPLSPLVSKELVLGSKDLPCLSGKIDRGTTDVAGLLRPWGALSDHSAIFQTPAGALGPGTQKLTVEQHFLFLPHSTTPAHEPAGVLTCARFYPLVIFKYPASPDDENPIAWLRVDFRLDIRIDSPATASSRGPRDQAGVFADYDSFPLPPSPDPAKSFRRAEKPLRVEIVGNGIRKSQPGHWDNIHHWGTQTPLPSTPRQAPPSSSSRAESTARGRHATGPPKAR